MPLQLRDLQDEAPMPTGQAERLMPTLRRVVMARQSAARSDGELLTAFIAESDADAFAELVRRHGPMVLGVCRRVVGDRATADDAFQAVFLVLARRAAAVRPREQVGNFLYGVAYRTALKARTVLARRRSREKQVTAMPEPTAPTAAEWTDLGPVIDEELDKLPDKLRLPVVLCDLEGRPQREVAKHLKVPPATLATRLASARRTLAQRLTRRGVTLSGGALAGLLSVHGSVSAVPLVLSSGVVRAAEACAAGTAVGSLVSANAVQLSEGVLRMMVLAKLKAIAVVAVTALVLTTGLGVGLVPATADDVPKSGTQVEIKLVPADAPKSAPAVAAKAAAPADDATFLKRLTMDVRGTPPTDVELFFFVSDEDNEKRAKVVDWMTTDEAAKQAVAKKLGVPIERIKVLRGKVSADGRFVEVKLEATPGTRVVKPLTLDSSTMTIVTAGNKLEVNGPGRLILKDADVTATRLQGKVVADPTGDPNKTAIAVLEKFVVADDKTPTTTDITRARIDHDIVKLWNLVDADGPNKTEVNDVFVVWDVSAADSDGEFLKRVLTDVRGSGPTALETKYFTEDKDPKKREKLIDTLLKEPAVQKKLGDAWKVKMLAPVTAKIRTTEVKGQRIGYAPPDGIIRLSPQVVTGVPLPPQPPAPPKPPVVVKPLAPAVPQPPIVVKPLPPPQPPIVVKPVQTVEGIKVVGTIAAPTADKYEKLVDALIAAKKDDAAILEAVTLATLGRLPTDIEKKLAATVGKAADRKGAWVGVARALAGADDKPVEVKVKVIGVTTPPPAPPLPPAKP